ncbi:MAG: site-specific DNA-methyltransferase [Chloroflexi bacterium]|nr:MAG: site-specific DNA-methyltransferase [Anaerolineaceae bacterium 4572_32.2]RLC98621.1 MAG: site-specific DNA-methyltransferase [Chloroflexota bacterium]
MKNNPLPRLDKDKSLRQKLLPLCRLKPGEIWIDSVNDHKIGCLDATNSLDVERLLDGTLAKLAIHDPPYNLVAFRERKLDEYIDWCKKWVANTWRALDQDSALYIWIGADQRNHYQPLPDFMIMMREFDFEPKSFLTMRNQRGYGTQKNWMAVRQELLYYAKGNPFFQVQYTDIPKILRGYYKKVGERITENLERSKSNTIRPGNVWVDIQQVFYRLEENVSGCYAQKPLKSIERIIQASSTPGDLIIDFFSHSGTTLIASELHNRRCFTIDIDPIYCEISIRRLERLRKTGKLGWQNGHPFEHDLPDVELAERRETAEKSVEIPQQLQPQLI